MRLPRPVPPAARLPLLALLALPLAGCGPSFGWHVVDPTDPRGAANLAFLLSGLWPAVVLSVSAMALSVALGLMVALAGFGRLAPLRLASRAWVELFRSVPILVALLWVYYGLPVVADIRLGIFAAAVLAIALCDSAFEAEIFRAGIQSVERGQMEAAMALGLSPWQAFRFVVFPQALRRVLPPLGNQFVYVVKMSSLASVIGYEELTRRANELNVTLHRPLEIYSVLVLEYLVLVLAISAGVRWMERRLGADQTIRREG
ncbi:MAG: amino acid ABC transporter permease [Acetobacteraceae bacterium]|nr:amino acid ABC transporter permease [Acetobacteraceae bacterium]